MIFQPQEKIYPIRIGMSYGFLPIGATVGNIPRKIFSSILDAIFVACSGEWLSTSFLYELLLGQGSFAFDLPLKGIVLLLFEKS